MSFDVLANSAVARRKEEITIEINGNSYKFFAEELPYLAKVNMAVAQQANGDGVLFLLTQSIRDEKGQRMSREQAEQLSPEHIEIFLSAANRVNWGEQAEKN